MLYDLLIFIIRVLVDLAIRLRDPDPAVYRLGKDRVLNDVREGRYRSFERFVVWLAQKGKYKEEDSWIGYYEGWCFRRFFVEASVYSGDRGSEVSLKVFGRRVFLQVY